MREVIIKSEFDHSYLLINDEGLEENYEYHMLTRNKIIGVLDCKSGYFDEKSYCVYDITSKKSIQQEYVTQKMGFDDLVNLFYGIHMSIKRAGEYLLRQENFLFWPQYIFKDLDSGELECLYFPDPESEENEKRKSYKVLADFLLDKVDHKDEHAVNITYHFYKISKEEFFSFESFVSFMEKESVLIKAKEKRERIREEESIPIRIKEMSSVREEEYSVNEVMDETEDEYPKWWISGGMLILGAIPIILYFSIPFFNMYPGYVLLPGMTIIVWAVILLIRNIILIYRERQQNENTNEEKPISIEEFFDDGIDDVTVFFDKQEYLCLKWKEGRFSREYSMVSFPLTIGKLREGVQIEINDASVSRLHARFRKQGSSILLQDLDSTNGTYINGRRIQTGEDAIIKRGDEIQFGKIIVNVV